MEVIHARCAGPAVLAGRGGRTRAAAGAAIAMAAMSAAFQLLGLGHLMTIFGAWAMTMAFTFLIVRFEALARPRHWWLAIGLLTLCFLAYFAGLLFALAALGMALPFLWIRDRPSARALVGAAAVASLAAFVLYYVHWTWPFLSVSAPQILGASSSFPAGHDTKASLLLRLAAEPHKLAYTFGAAIIPVAGLAGLTLAPRRASKERRSFKHGLRVNRHPRGGCAGG